MSRRAPDPWTDDAPAIAGPQDFTGDGDTFMLSVLDGALRFELDRVRIERGDLWGTLTVRTTLSGARTYNGGTGTPTLTSGAINLSSPDTRSRRAKQLADLLQAPQIDVHRVVEGFSIRVHDRFRIGEPAVDLRSVQPASAVDALDVHGIQILDKHPIFWFGDGGAGKSKLALYIGGELGRRGITVLFVDWELSAEDHRARLGRLFGDDMPRMLYARCARPLTAEVDRIRRIVREQHVDYLILDSVAFACDGRPEDAEVAVRYFQCLRQIGTGSLNIAHTNKSDESDKKPFGSSFWHNGARASWNVKLADDTTMSNTITVGCYNRKANLSARLPAVGFRLAFEPDRTHVTRVDLACVDDLAAELPLWQRMTNTLRQGPRTVEHLADELNAKPDAIRKAAQRSKQLFTKLDGGHGIPPRLALVERRTT